MKTVIIKNWRSEHEVLTTPMTEKELREAITKGGRISAKVLVDFNDLVSNDIEWLNDEASEKITNSVGGLVDISYKVAGRTPNNELIVKVDGGVEFDYL